MGPSSKGTSALPVARVSKIVKSDKDIAMCSKEALFLMSMATEEFIKKLTLASASEARANKRKGIQYKDLATAIQQDDAYFYLQEVIPQPLPADKAVKARKKKFAEAAGDVVPEAAAAAAEEEEAAAVDEGEGISSHQVSTMTADGADVQMEDATQPPATTSEAQPAAGEPVST